MLHFIPESYYEPVQCSCLGTATGWLLRWLAVLIVSCLIALFNNFLITLLVHIRGFCKDNLLGLVLNANYKPEFENLEH